MQIRPTPAAISSLAEDRQSIFVLGDSFAQNPFLQDQFPRAQGGRLVTIDGVGGSTLAEQGRRFNALTDQWKSFLVILDGGLEDPNAARPISDIIAQLDSGCGRWLYVEPPHSVSHGRAGSEAYRRQTALVEQVRQRWPEHLVPLIDSLRAGAQDTAADQAAIAAGWTPVSLRQDNDPIHLNEAGNHILVEAISAAIARVERARMEPCLGPTMDQLQTAADAP